MSPDDRSHDELNPEARHPEELRQVWQALSGLKFGSLLVIVQDGVIVQLERTEKTRLRGNRNR